MRKMKSNLPTVETIPMVLEVAPTERLPAKDLLVGSRLRPWGWVRYKVTDEAVLLGQRCNPSELREIAQWCEETARWLDSK